METITIGGITMSVPIADFAADFSAAQLEMQNAMKGSTNPFFSKGEHIAKYADLGTIIEATRPHLPKHGIALTQMPFDLDGRIGLTTMLIHKSGQFIAGTFSMKPTQDTPQADGSCLTYLRRYTAPPAVGLGISDASDDDGNKASNTEGDKTAPPKEAAGRKNGRKPAIKPLAKISLEQVYDSAALAIMARAREVISVATGELQFQRCEASILEHADAGRIDAMQCAELSTLLAKRRAETEANQDLQAAATS